MNRIDIYIEHWLRKVNKSTDVDGQKNDINGCLLLHTVHNILNKCNYDIIHGVLHGLFWSLKDQHCGFTTYFTSFFLFKAF